MAKKKCKCPAGVPEWVVTYGDMMSLLLTFFILLAAFSELKRDHEYQRVVTAVKEAFGYSGGIGVMPTQEPPLRSMIESLEALAKQKLDENKVSQAQDPGMSGKVTTVSQVHEGLKFTIGGHLTFKPGSAELLDGAKTELLKVARMLKGRQNKISVRGHAATKPLAPGGPFRDLRDLSYFRARAVADFLVTEGGLEPTTIAVDARGDTEPIHPRTYTPEEQAVNRRVEIIQTEALVDDFHPDSNYSSEEVARTGG